MLLLPEEQKGETWDILQSNAILDIAEIIIAITFTFFAYDDVLCAWISTFQKLWYLHVQGWTT